MGWRTTEGSGGIPRYIGAAAHEKRGQYWLREAALSSFCDPLPVRCHILRDLSLAQWRHLLRWLDITGIALYFLDRMAEMRLSDWVHPSVLERLQQNLADNTERTHGMAAESIAIQQDFQKVGLHYANLKGISFWPSSVPRPELRSQGDIDFLVASRSAQEARRILEQRGYQLNLVGGRSWEFKRNERPGGSLKDLYKAAPSYTVELHIEPDGPSHSSPLDRIEFRDIYGFSMPVLSPVDLFLGQGVHAYKHICSEFSRSSHLLEFRRHILARYHDDEFWGNVRSVAGTSRAILGLGITTRILSHVMGDFAPEALTEWTVNELPPSVHLWVKLYGRRAVFGDMPGSKLYLLLQNELYAAGVSSRRSVRQTLVPRRLPPLIIRAIPNEPLARRLGRYRMQLRYILLRLRFHVVEGIRFAWARHKWQRQTKQLFAGCTSCEENPHSVALIAGKQKNDNSLTNA